MVLINNRRLKAIRLDIETLEKTGVPSLMISVDLTESMVEMIVNKLKGDYPHASDMEILAKTRQYLFHDLS